MIAGAPSPEVQFLHNALLRDQHVEFAVVASTRRPRLPPGRRSPDHAAAKRRRMSFGRTTLSCWSTRTCEHSAQWPDMITKFVGQEGGGLIFVAGELYSQQLFDTEDDKSSGSELDAHPARRPRAGPVPDRG